jgi:ribA/ribD-fused uncharacterized protein
MAEKKEWVRNWFSNMLPFDEPLVYQGIVYLSVENFYQAMKLPKDRVDLRAEIAALDPRKSKVEIRNDKKYPWREDWTKEEALKVMEFALRHKFAEGTSWAEKLLETGSEEIIEWNNWKDIYWGRCIHTNKGENHLGKLLMRVREDLQNALSVNTEYANDRPTFRSARAIFEDGEKRIEAINAGEPESYKTPEERLEQFKKGNGQEG